MATKKARKSRIRPMTGIPAWCIDKRHGEFNQKRTHRFCAKHMKFIATGEMSHIVPANRDLGEWGKHKDCTKIGSKPKASRSKPKRVSKVVHICSKHGKFVGFAWCGHRRLCKAKEIINTGKGGTLMERTLKTLQRANNRNAVAVRVEENNAVPMAESVTLRKHSFTTSPAYITAELTKALLEIGIKKVGFSKFETTQYLKAHVVETIKDHPTLLPYIPGDMLTGVCDEPFKSEEQFASLINNSVERKDASMWVTIKRGEAAAIRRTVTFRSTTPAEELATPRVVKKDDTIFVPTENIIMKVEQRLSAIDAQIANAEAEAKMFDQEAREHYKKRLEAMDNSRQRDKLVGELQGQRNEFLKKLADIAK